MPVLSNGSVVRVKVPDRRTRLRRPTGNTKILVIRGPRGEQGTPGLAGAFGIEFLHTDPSASWIHDVPASLGRVPQVSIYDLDGNKVETDVVVTSTVVSASFPSPFAGLLLMT